ncbi:MAG: SpoIID/LytB domain-containing protein [Clostridia bacterium]|nr:SpoIID/LytB domain-containing protein [Clostridia bacterium]
MRRGSQLFVSILVVLSLLVILFSNTSVLAQTYPESVRVGLYYGKSPASSVALNSKAGLEVGYYQNGQFTTLLTEAGGLQTIVRKDAYFIKSTSGSLQEYTPDEGIPFIGETFGPYHIQIGDKVADLTTAQNLAGTMRQSGVVAYPAYENGWAVWTGFYSDITLANQDIANLSAKLGTASLSVIIPSSSRVIVYNANFEPRLVFGNQDAKLTVRPNAANSPYVLSVNGKQYRGEIELRRYTDSDMTVINILNIEQYLYGVVPGEIESTSPPEALKAQAVAARTHVYMNMNKYSKWGFDVVNSTDSQVYSGFDFEKPSTNLAVDATKGKKVMYNGRLASLFYYSSSGGMTEDNVNVWGSDIAYLKSVADPYEAGTSYNYTWTRTFTAADIKLKLFLSGVEIGDIVSMSAEEYTPAGRVNKLKVVGTLNSITYNKEDIRVILGDKNGTYLPSRMFTINSGSAAGASPASATVLSGDGTTTTLQVSGSKAVTADGTHSLAGTNPLKVLSASGSASLSSSAPIASGTFVLTGRGWGHGVGMSQEGAKGFARNGYTYDQILMYYFKGTVIE